MHVRQDLFVINPRNKNLVIQKRTIVLTQVTETLICIVNFFERSFDIVGNALN